MMMKFEQWLMERGARTCMGAGQPPQAGSAQLPPLAHAAANPGHINSIVNLHNDHPELLNPELRKIAKNNGSKKEKNPWENSFKNTKEAALQLLRKRISESERKSYGVGKCDYCGKMAICYDDNSGGKGCNGCLNSQE